MKIKVQLDEGAILPTKAHEEDAGYDLYLPSDVRQFYVHVNDMDSVQAVSSIICFLVGVMTGGFGGIFLMALLIGSKTNEEER